MVLQRQLVTAIGLKCLGRPVQAILGRAFIFADFQMSGAVWDSRELLNRLVLSGVI